MVLVQKMNSTDYFVGLAELSATLSIQSSLKLFNLSQFFQSSYVLIRFQTKKGDVSFDLASFSMDLTVIVLVNFLHYAKRVKGLLSKVGFVLLLTKCHYDLGQVVGVGILF